MQLSAGFCDQAVCGCVVEPLGAWRWELVQLQSKSKHAEPGEGTGGCVGGWVARCTVL